MRVSGHVLDIASFEVPQAGVKRPWPVKFATMEHLENARARQRGHTIHGIFHMCELCAQTTDCAFTVSHMRATRGLRPTAQAIAYSMITA